jgi:single-stranded-DNA-specific exonuclease
MDTPYKALQMLLAAEDRLDEVMADIEDMNTKRKTATEKFASQALANVDENKNILIYDSTEVEHGIIGLIAGRLCEAHHKPTIALKDE